MVDYRIGKRSELTLHQRRFLESLVLWSEFVFKQTMMKARLFKRQYTSTGLRPSIFIAAVIIATDWENHPISKEKFKTKQANNLLLLEYQHGWCGAKSKYDGRVYKLFDNWEAFCIHYSDLAALKSPAPYLNENLTLEEQLSLYCGLNLTLADYNEKMLTLIKDLHLEEFDYGCHS